MERMGDFGAPLVRGGKMVTCRSGLVPAWLARRANHGTREVVTLADSSRTAEEPTLGAWAVPHVRSVAGRTS